MELLKKGSATPVLEAAKSWSADFCLSPTRFIGGRKQPDHVHATEFEMTKLSSNFDPSAKASLTGRTINLSSSVVFRSIGYKSVALPEFAGLGIPFDDSRGILKNDGLGRALQLEPGKENSVKSAPKPAAGLYCSGWVKRGPTGVIASTMEDAFSTGDSIVQDWLSGVPFLGDSATGEKDGWNGVKNDVGDPTCKVVTWSEWQRIDKAEKERGRRAGKEREKFTSTADMLAVLD
jgi:adrenodoxin-NADP+ reductase